MSKKRQIDDSVKLAAMQHARKQVEKINDIETIRDQIDPATMFRLLQLITGAYESGYTDALIAVITDD